MLKKEYQQRYIGDENSADSILGDGIQVSQQSLVGRQHTAACEMPRLCARPLIRGYQIRLRGLVEFATAHESHYHETHETLFDGT